MEIDKQYEIILNNKNQIESRREEINKYYTSLFTALIALMPYIDKLTAANDCASKGNNGINYMLMLLSFLGIILSISWRLALGHMYYYIKGIEEFLAQIEKKSEIGFITYMFTYLTNTQAPKRVTKQQMLVPNTFMVIFSLVFINSLRVYLIASGPSIFSPT
jgi:hypothetical protein